MQTVQFIHPGEKQKIEIYLDKTNGDQELLVLFIGKGNEEYYIDTTMNHMADRTKSLTTIRGVLLDQSKAIVNGLIKIGNHAEQSQAFLEEKILLIGTNTQAEALPKLEIKTDNVKASHAASVGRLDEEELFYLQSRGLSLEAAQRMIIKGFFQSIIDKIKDSTIKNTIESKLANFD